MYRSLHQALSFLAVALVFHTAELQAHPPSGIVVDDRGVIYFQDALEGVWRLEDGKKPALANPQAWHWLAIDPQGKFADAPDEFGEWYARVSPKGTKPALVACSDFPCAIGTDGNLYSAHMHSLKLVRRTPAGAESILVEPKDFGVDATRPFGVTGLTSGPNGSLYLFLLADDTGQHAVYAVSKDGVIREVAKNFVTEKIPTNERHPEMMPEYSRGLAADRQGNVFIAVTGNRCVMKLPREGRPSTVLKAEKPWTPTGAAEHDGVLYVLEYDDETPTDGRGWPLRVRKVDRDGKVTMITAIRE